MANLGAHSEATQLDPFAERERILSELAARLPAEVEAFTWSLNLQNILLLRDLGRISPAHAQAMAAGIARQ